MEGLPHPQRVAARQRMLYSHLPSLPAVPTTTVDEDAVDVTARRTVQHLEITPTTRDGIRVSSLRGVNPP
jgi:hypothetical protein